MNIVSWTTNWARNNDLKIQSLETCESTNDFAKNHLGTTDLILTASQTSGRGRGENTWSHGSAGENLLASLIFKLSDSPSHLISPLIGLGLFKSLKKTWHQLNLSLKAPNDVYIDKKKLAGLLLETTTTEGQTYLIIGLGLNVGSTPTEIKTSGCLADYLDSPITEPQWTLFLQAFYQICQEVLDTASIDDFLFASKPELLQALNSYPMLTEPYIDISQTVDLITKNKKISWQEL